MTDTIRKLMEAASKMDDIDFEDEEENLLDETEDEELEEASKGSDEELYPERDGDGAVTDMKPDWPNKPEDSNPELKEGYTEVTEEDIEHLEELQQRLLQVVGEIDQALEGTTEYSRARAYWLGQLHIAASEDHSYMGNNANMEEAIRSLREQIVGGEGYEDLDDDPLGDHHGRNY